MPHNLHPADWADRRDAARDESIDIAGFLAVLLRGKGTIALITALALLCGGYYAYVVAVPIYRSTAVVILETREEQVLTLDSVVSGLSGDSATVNSEVEVFKSRSLLGKVVDRLDLTRDPEFNRTLRQPGLQWRLKAALRGFFDRLARAVGQVPRSAAAPAPQTLAEFGQTEQGQTAQGQTAQGQTAQGQTAQGQTAQMRAELIRAGTVDALLARLTVRNIPQTVVFEVTVASEDPRKAARLADTLVELYVLNQIEAKFAATEQATAWLTDRVATLQAELEAAEARLKSFSAGADLIDRETLVGLERRLKESRDLFARATLDAGRPAGQQQALSDQVAALETQIARQNADLIALQQLNREAEATRLLYEYFLGRLKETAAQQGIQQADSRILSQAVVPGTPSEPRKSRMLALSGLIGLLGGATLVLLREARRRGFRTARDLEDFAGQTVMGQIPLLPARWRRRAVAYLRARPISVTAEAVRNLRTSILLASPDAPPQVIAITSSVSGEGKTTLALALAQTFAGMNRKVLLIEGDIRRRVMRAQLGIVQSRGLLSVLNGAATLEETVVAQAILGADVLLADEPVADRVASAADLFCSPEFAQLIDRARQRYDTILIDTPPVLVVPDARVIAQLADVTLFVVKWDSTPRAQVDEALHMFDSSGQRIHGLILNQVSPRGMRRYGAGPRAYGAYGGRGGGYYAN